MTIKESLNKIPVEDVFAAASKNLEPGTAELKPHELFAKKLVDALAVTANMATFFNESDPTPSAQLAAKLNALTGNKISPNEILPKVEARGVLSRTTDVVFFLKADGQPVPPIIAYTFHDRQGSTDNLVLIKPAPANNAYQYEEHWLLPDRSGLDDVLDKTLSFIFSKKNYPVVTALNQLNQVINDVVEAISNK